MKTTIQLSLRATDFGTVKFSTKLEKGNCRWGGKPTAAGDWCGAKVRNAGHALKGDAEFGIIAGNLFSFVQKSTDFGGWRPERNTEALWICENHREAFLDMHESWSHEVVQLTTNGYVELLVDEPDEQMFEVSFRFYDANGNADAHYVNGLVQDAMQAAIRDEDRVEYIKVIG